MKKSLLKTGALFGGIFVIIGLAAMLVFAPTIFAEGEDDDLSGYNEEDVINIPEPKTGDRLPRHNLNTMIWVLQKLYGRMTTQCSDGYVFKGFAPITGNLVCVDNIGNEEQITTMGLTLGLNLVNSQTDDTAVNKLIGVVKTLYSTLQTRCPDGQVMSGFGSNGSITCRTPQGGVVSTQPSAPTIISIVAGDSSINLSWNTPFDGGESITGYKIKRSINQVTWNTAMDWTLTNSFTDSGLTNGTTYYYQVQAQNIKGPSDWSETRSATPEAGPASCNLPWGGMILHGASTPAYQAQIHPVNCDNIKEMRTCDDGKLSGSYQYRTCSVDGGCVPDCSCAANTCIGSVCDNGCEATCDGIKDCSGGGPMCGDGNLDEGEGEDCDDGNTNNGDGCSSSCLWETGSSDCVLPPEAEGTWKWNGDSSINQTCSDSDGSQCVLWTPALPNTVYSLTPDACHYNCQSGYSWNGSNCEETTSPPSCGNGTVDEGEGEECDDGNTKDDDGCSSSCTWETRSFDCELPPEVGGAWQWNGNSALNQTCDNSNGSQCTSWTPVLPATIYSMTTDTCHYECAAGYSWNGSNCEEEIPPAPCGNGSIDAGEECDDGNNNNEDGCAANCEWETRNFVCSNTLPANSAWNTVPNYLQTCTNSNGSSCTNWTPVSDNVTEYNETGTEDSCQFKCENYHTYFDGPSECILNTCVGTTPSNATLCLGDSIKIPTAGVTKTLVSSCGTPKCEYTCNGGYTFYNGVCAQTPEAPILNAAPGNGSVDLQWNIPNNNGAGITGFTLQRRLSDQLSVQNQNWLKRFFASLVAVQPGSWSTISSVGGSVTSYTDTGRINGTSYDYQIKATNPIGDSDWSGRVTAVPTTLTPPRGLNAERGDEKVTLSWNPPADDGGYSVTGYTIERKVEIASGDQSVAIDLKALQANLVAFESGTYATIATNVNSTSYTDTNVINGQTYTYRVYAHTSKPATSDESLPASATPAGVPNTVGSFNATAGRGKITLSWSTPSGNGSPVTSYIIQRQYDDGVQSTALLPRLTANLVGVTSWATIASGVTGNSYIDSDVVSSRVYTYRIAATNVVGTGSYINSSGVSALPTTKTWTCPTPDNHSLSSRGTSWNWNTVGSYSQGWDEEILTWDPADDNSTNYSSTFGSTTDCRFKCLDGYHYELSTCIENMPDPICGDGNLDTPNADGINEQCDDGNVNNGDGCSSTCQWEPRTYSCPSKPTTGTMWNTVSSYSQTCAASNGTSCTAWSPATDTITDYNTTSSTNSCRYKCASGYYRSNGECVAYECLGDDPNNSTMCSGDNTNLFSNPVKVAVNSCTSRKCEWQCDGGRIASGGLCVDPSYYWEVGSWACPAYETRNLQNLFASSIFSKNDLIAEYLQCQCSSYTRSVRCKRNPDGVGVSDSYCSSPKPDTSFACTVPPAPTSYSWDITSTSSACQCCAGDSPPPSFTCNANQGKKAVYNAVCKDNNGNTVSDSYCQSYVGAKPEWTSCYRSLVFSSDECWGTGP